MLYSSTCLFFSTCTFCLLKIGTDRDGTDNDSEKGNNDFIRRPLMRALTNAQTQSTNKQSDQNLDLPTLSNWRHPRANLNRLRSIDLSNTGKGDPAPHTNAASSSHRFRSHNAFNKLIHPQTDFSRSMHFFFSNLYCSIDCI